MSPTQRWKRQTQALGAALAISVSIGPLAFAASSVKPTTADDHTWKTYYNQRFQVSICYPADLLKPQGEPDNGDGQVFAGRDGTHLLVFGSFNALETTLAEEMAASAQRLAGASGRITYQLLKPTWFVLSGQNGRTVFYTRKALHGTDQFKTFELSYDVALSGTYDPLIARITGCFAETPR